MPVHATRPDSAETRPALPSAWTVLGFGLLASPIFSFIHASQFVLQSRLDVDRTRNTFGWEWAHLLPPWVAFAVAAAAIVPFVRRFPLPQPRPAKAILAHILGALAFPVVHLGLLDLYHALPDPSRLADHLVWMLADNYVTEVMLFWAVAGTLHAIRHVRVQRALREDALRLQAALAEARFAALSQQMRPHFLFNALNSAAMLVRAGESTQAIELLARLSNLIRELLREHPNEVVPLSEELAFLEDYLVLEETRFGDRLGVTVDCDRHVADSPVPFLILQPIVENALRHGVAARAGRSQLHVAASRGTDGVVLRVEERGAGGRAGAAEEPGHGVGLANTRERLRVRYGDAASFTLRVDPGGTGSLAEIVLPNAG
jgi:hypothetical protein